MALSSEYEVVLAVDGMTCTACERRVEQALTQAGARNPRANWRSRTVTFRMPADADLERFRRAVAAAGGSRHHYVPGEARMRPLPGAGGTAPVSEPADVDFVILGSGSAAFAAAIEARQLGASVVMIERGTIGGTCVNIGCVPSKFLLRAAEVAHEARTSPYQAVVSRLEGIDLAAHVAQKRALIAELRREKYEDLIAFYGWELIRGEGRFVDGQTVEVNGLRIRARAILIATGAQPAVPPIPGLRDVPFLTSTTALDLDHIPASLAILGAGYVALELGQAFQRLGSAVTLIQRRPRLLPEAEPELASALQQALEAEGMRFALGSHVLQIERVGAGVRLTLNQSGHTETIEADALLVATGRQPNTDQLNLRAAGVAVDDRGAPAHDATLRTTNPRVYVAGDVTLGPQFVYVAAYEGRLAARNALLGEARPADLSTVPAVIFTSPQVASVGQTRAQAETAGYSVVSGFAPAAVIARERVNLQPYGGVLVVADADSEQILGVHAVATAAGELIEAATLAVVHRLTLDDLRNHLSPYLTSSEGLRLAALAVTQDVARLSCCA